MSLHTTEAAEIDGSLAPAISTPLHILIVEDQDMVAQWVRGHLSVLKREFPRARIDIVYTLDAALTAINKAESPPNITFLDLSLTDSTMVNTIAHVPDFTKKTAIVIITGHKTEDVERLLVDAKVEVLEKKSISSMGLVQAAVRALMRHDMAENQKRMQENREILAHLHAAGYGISQERE